VESFETGFLRLVTVGQQVNGIPALATKEGRLAVEAALWDAEVLIIDSISTLAWMETNEEENWLEFLYWLNRLRNHYRLCVLFLHHAGKSGMQRGHSRSEDTLDLSIRLSRAPEDDADYCRFTLHYDKIRADRKGIRDWEVSFKEGAWTFQTSDASRLDTLKDYLEDHPNASVRRIKADIGEQLGLSSLGSISALKNRLDVPVPAYLQRLKKK